MSKHKRVKRTILVPCGSCLGTGHQCAVCKGTGNVERVIVELVSDTEGKC